MNESCKLVKKNLIRLSAGSLSGQLGAEAMRRRVRLIGTPSSRSTNQLSVAEIDSLGMSAGAIALSGNRVQTWVCPSSGMPR